MKHQIVSWRVRLLLALLFAWLSPAFAQSATDGFDPGADGAVRAVVQLDDGGLIVTGDFNSIGGVAQARIARLRIDGSVDTSFAPVITGANITDAEPLADGRIAIVGDFTQVNGLDYYTFAVLQADGSLDPAAPQLIPSQPIYAIARQSTGKLIIGGGFVNIGDHPVQGGLARLNSDGTVDTAFDAPFVYETTALAVDAQDRILATGSHFNLEPYGFNRLLPDGAIDPTFVMGEDVMWSLYSGVKALAIQSDGGIVVAGVFTVTDGDSTWSHLLRLDADGALDAGFHPAPDGVVSGVDVQTDGRIVVAGAFANIGGGVRGNVARLHIDGSLDSGFAPVLDNAATTVRVLQDGNIVLGGGFTAIDGTPRQRLARVAPGGALDVDFIAGRDPVYPGISGSGFFGSINTLLLQPDGKLLVGGAFSFIGLEPGGGLARFLPDGSIDTSFAILPTALDTIALQPDGRILIAGAFDSIGGVPRPGIARLHADGSLDSEFAPPSWWQPGLTDAWVTSLLLLPDGKVLMAGLARDAQQTSIASLLRLLPDGSIDTTFAADVVSNNNSIVSLAVDAQDRIYISGLMQSVGGAPRNGIARLHADGSVDATFAPSVDSYLMTLQVQADGKVLIGGFFTSVNGTPRPNLARLLENGALDATYAPVFPGNPMLHSVQNLLLQADGSVLAAVVDDNYITRFQRVLGDGTVDANFLIESDGAGGNIAQQADGKVIVTGGFEFINGVERLSIARVSQAQAAMQDLSLDDDGALHWQRGGASPELRATTFDVSVDGNEWTALGNGERNADGWLLDGIANALPSDTDAWIRARGYSASARGAHGSLFESVRRVRTPLVNIVEYTVTPQAGAGGAIEPNAPVVAAAGSTVAFQIVPDAGFAIDSVSGCDGTLVGSTLTTAPLTQDCSVTATFVQRPAALFADGFED